MAQTLLVPRQLSDWDIFFQKISLGPHPDAPNSFSAGSTLGLGYFFSNILTSSSSGCSKLFYCRIHISIRYFLQYSPKALILMPNSVLTPGRSNCMCYL